MPSRAIKIEVEEEIPRLEQLRQIAALPNLGLREREAAMKKVIEAFDEAYAMQQQRLLDLNQEKVELDKVYQPVLDEFQKGTIADRTSSELIKTVKTIRKDNTGTVQVVRHIKEECSRQLRNFEFQPGTVHYF